MNIIEAYIKFRGGLIILVSGLSGCGKSILAKKISHDFGLKYIKESDYYKTDYTVETVLPDGIKMINIHTDDAIDWDKLNKDLENLRKDGVIISGTAFPQDLIKAPIDYHIHLAISKQRCIEKRRDYLEKHKEKYPEEYALLGTATEKLKMNQMIYPYYLQSKERATIDLTIQGTEIDDEQIYDQAFNELIKFIENYLYHERVLDNNINDKDKNSSTSSSQDGKIKDGPIIFLETPEDARFWYEYEDSKVGL
jgi:cytidylate kinase